jgi:hypothetical protein
VPDFNTTVTRVPAEVATNTNPVASGTQIILLDPFTYVGGYLTNKNPLQLSQTTALTGSFVALGTVFDQGQD